MENYKKYIISGPSTRSATWLIENKPLDEMFGQKKRSIYLTLKKCSYGDDSPTFLDEGNDEKYLIPEYFLACNMQKKKFYLYKMIDGNDFGIEDFLHRADVTIYELIKTYTKNEALAEGFKWSEIIDLADWF